jgi:GABA permease
MGRCGVFPEQLLTANVNVHGSHIRLGRASEVAMGTDPTASGGLSNGLSERKLRMLAVGGVIGAGLFVGSGVVITATGPASFITYALAGVLVILVMRMLAEMAVAHPSTGSFADYSRAALGDWAGFSVGWLYWYFWVIIIGFEAIAGAKILRFWLPGIPIWVSALVMLAAMTATNLFSVASFGEFEFWFAGIKVAAIIAFIAMGAAYVLGLWPNKSLDFSNLTSHGGFLPNGPSAITVAIVTAMLSMVGAEIATIAAAESKDPARSVAKAANSVIARIAVFFVGSTFLVVVIEPWNNSSIAASPFVAAMTHMGIGSAAHIMNAVVLTAVLSCLNSGIYSASRMLFVLAARREAPPHLISVTRRGVPAVAILTSSFIGLICVIFAAFFESSIFAFLLNSSGALILFVYLLIAVSQVTLRLRHPEQERKVKMWLFPVLSIVAGAAMIAILIQMAVTQASRSQFILSSVSWAVVIVLFFANKAYVASRPTVPDVPATGRPGRVLVLANQTIGSAELQAELQRIGAAGEAVYHVVVPLSPVETGAAASHGAVNVAEVTHQIAQERLEATLAAMREANLNADGELGDYRPLRALAAAVGSFKPDQIVISTLPPEDSIWQRFDVVDRARSEHNLPVTHVIAGRR